MRIALAQLNTIVGDVAGNSEKALHVMRSNGDCDLIIFPELLTTGYPPRDLLYRSDLIANNLIAKEQIVKATAGIKGTVVFGYVEPNKEDGGKGLFNAACSASGGIPINNRRKSLLPTYDVFEEDIYFEPGKLSDFSVFDVGDTKVGVIICEEAWNDDKFWPQHLYPFDPVDEIVKAGASYIVIINASPFRIGDPQGKELTPGPSVMEVRRRMIADHARTHGVGIAYVNQVGFNDDVGFDGNSFAVDETGEIIAHAAAFIEDCVVFDTKGLPVHPMVYERPWQQDILDALTLGVRDYFTKQDIKGPAIIGLSGGIDSALVAYLAAQAVGPERVIGIGMPAEFSSSHSKGDAYQLATNLGVTWVLAPIHGMHESAREVVDLIAERIEGTDKVVYCKDSGVTDENLQARSRGELLMAIANKYNGLVLSTGNKSEMAVGYCTLYGDMCGGLAVISDIIKTWVFDLCKWINEVNRSAIIPVNTITKPPSAELRPGQTDQQSLPPYELLDQVVVQAVDNYKSPYEIVNLVADAEYAAAYMREHDRMIEDDIMRVCRLITRAQFKRVQSPTGLKVTKKLFKMGYRVPIVHKLLP